MQPKDVCELLIKEEEDFQRQHRPRLTKKAKFLAVLAALGVVFGVYSIATKERQPTTQELFQDALNQKLGNSLFEESDAQEWKETAKERYSELKDDFQDILKAKNLTWDDIKEAIANRRWNQTEEEAAASLAFESDDMQSLGFNFTEIKKQINEAVKQGQKTLQDLKNKNGSLGENLRKTIKEGQDVWREANKDRKNKKNQNQPATTTPTTTTPQDTTTTPTDSQTTQPTTEEQAAETSTTTPTNDESSTTTTDSTEPETTTPETTTEAEPTPAEVALFVSLLEYNSQNGREIMEELRRKAEQSNENDNQYEYLALLNGNEEFKEAADNAKDIWQGMKNKNRTQINENIKDLVKQGSDIWKQIFKKKNNTNSETHALFHDSEDNSDWKEKAAEKWNEWRENRNSTSEEQEHEVEGESTSEDQSQDQSEGLNEEAQQALIQIKKAIGRNTTLLQSIIEELKH